MQITSSRQRPLRWHLVQVLLLGILPVGVLAASLLYLHWRAQLAEHERNHKETTRLLAAAVDNEIDGTIKRLTILARLFSAPNIDRLEMHQHAASAVAASPDWIGLLAASADGNTVFRTDAPFGTSLQSIADRSYFKRALAEGRPVVSELFYSPVLDQRVIAVAVPWVESGKVTYVLAASLNPRWFDEMLRRHAVPPGGVSGIFDNRMRFISRSHDAEKRRGDDPAPGLHADMLRSPEGTGRYPSLDGTQVYTTWAGTRHGWWVALAEPAAALETPFWRHLILLCALLPAMIAAGVAFAILKGRRIGDSLVLLERCASDLGHGRPLGPARGSDVVEIDRALVAVTRAGDLLEKARHERDELLEETRRGRAAAEDANRAKDEFLAMLGHELRNPLAAVSNAAEVIRSGNRTPEQLEFAAAIIHRQSGHLKRMIDDLLDVGRVMTGKILLERRAVDIGASVQQVLSALRTAGLLEKREVDVQAPSVWVSGDQTRLEQVVSNLLTNAAAHTPPGGHIGITLVEENGDAVLRVRDNGTGIAAESLPRLFDLFYQGERPQHRPGSGLGIGLTLVKRLVELHGGSVSAASGGRGRGALFTVRLPAIAAPAPAPAMTGSREHAVTVLIVEDDADERESLRVALEQRGHRVLQADGAPAALDALRAERPDLALIDIGLPETDGYALARAIRSSRGADIVLIALTGYGLPADAQRAHEAGFDRHLVKPVPVSQLAGIIAQVTA